MGAPSFFSSRLSNKIQFPPLGQSFSGYYSLWTQDSISPKAVLNQECGQPPWCYSGSEQSEQSMFPLTVMAAAGKEMLDCFVL